jgi:hypothetical protein
LESSISGIAVLVAGGTVTLVRKRRDNKAAAVAAQSAVMAGDVSDMSDLTGFFFDKPPNPRTRTPGTKGWTTMVEEKLNEHGDLLVAIKGTLETVAQDAAGARRAAESEVEAQHVERERVQKRDAVLDD